MFLYQAIIFILPLASNGLVCISHHEYAEEGKYRSMVRSTCGSSNGFCVNVQYWDSDPAKKRGFSRGCDKNDCEDFGHKEHGWNSDGCKKNDDFGSDGYICCCQTDLCNMSPSSLLASVGPASVFISVLLLLRDIFNDDLLT